MRLFLLPISTRRTFVYCDKSALQSLQQSSTSKHIHQEDRSWINWLTEKAANTWSQWEQKPSGVQKKITTYGNAFLRRIPYEEWGLKSFPPLTSSLRTLYDNGQKPVPYNILFPPKFLSEDRVLSVLKTLSSERRDFHRSRMITCAIGAPLTLPFALVPVIPNIPGFYLLFRAYSHYRAFYGSKHLEYLVDNNHLQPEPSDTLDELYAKSSRSHLQTNNEKLLLDKNSSVTISEAFKIKEMLIEIERAVEQVETQVKKDQDNDKKNL